MKLLKIFGIVAGIHAFALLLIFLNPGCSSSKGQAASTAPASPPPADAPAAKADTPPVVTVPSTSPSPDVVALPSDVATAPAPASGGAFYSPTRPGTPAAEALEAHPADDVTPATAYTVGRGDSLWSIAKKNHLRVSVLASANHLRIGTTLRPGQKLIIPGKPPAHPSATENDAVGTNRASPAPVAAAAGPAGAGPVKHVVRSGETLGTIARHYGVRMRDLATANNISDPQHLRLGQELIIPAGGHASRAKSSANASAAAPAPSAPAAAAVPGANQDLDSGLPSTPSTSAPVIRIQPVPSTPAPTQSN